MTPARTLAMTPEHRQWLAMLDDRIKTARDSVWAPPLKIKAALAEIDAHRAKLAADKHPVLTPEVRRDMLAKWDELEGEYRALLRRSERRPGRVGFARE